MFGGAVTVDVVMGAGLSGLIAATELRRRRRVAVLETRERVDLGGPRA
jgi:monoamine oxidase